MKSLLLSLAVAAALAGCAAEHASPYYGYVNPEVDIGAMGGTYAGVTNPSDTSVH